MSRHSDLNPAFKLVGNTSIPVAIDVVNYYFYLLLGLGLISFGIYYYLNF